MYLLSEIYLWGSNVLLGESFGGYLMGTGPLKRRKGTDPVGGVGVVE